METSESHQHKLLSSLQNAGVSVPNNVSSIGDLTPPTFVSICAQSLNLIDQTASFPIMLPDTTIEKLKMCTDMALAIKRLGFIGDFTYYKLLYPSEDDLHKMIRFLLERLSRGDKTAEVNAGGIIKKDVLAHNGTIDPNYHSQKLEHPLSQAEDASFVISTTPNLCQPKLPALVDGQLSDEDVKTERDRFLKEETAAQGVGVDTHVSKADDAFEEQPSKIVSEREELQNQEKALMGEVTAKTSELQHLEEELELFKTATKKAFDDQNSIEFCIERLNAKRCNVRELKSQWDATRKPLEERKRNLEESLYANRPFAQEKLQKLRELELEKQLVLTEIAKREEEHSKISSDLEKQPKLPSRTSYIEQIKEITKNSRKQDADIKRILKETRELQLESNLIQERLHRTYAVLEEIVSREAKKEPLGRTAYKLLTSIHDSFEQISEKIITSDRIQREMAEHEKQLATMASRSLNVDKLQADLDAIMKENQYLEQRLKKKSP